MFPVKTNDRIEEKSRCRQGIPPVSVFSFLGKYGDIKQINIVKVLDIYILLM